MKARSQLRMGRNFHLSKAHVRAAATHPYLLCGWHTWSEIPLTSMPTSPVNGESVRCSYPSRPWRFPNWEYPSSGVCMTTR